MLLTTMSCDIAVAAEGDGRDDGFDDCDDDDDDDDDDDSDSKV